MTNSSISLITIVPIRSYLNIDTQKRQICKDNRKKTGIYRWTNVVSGKSYVGSSLDLSIRFRDYFNINYLRREIEKNNSKIYRALLKYGHSSFNLEVIEYCDPAIIIEREQYYFDNLRLEYNTLKFARSLIGFKHNIKTLERMRIVKLGRKHNEATKLKLSANLQAHPITAINNETGESKEFTSIRQTAKFIGIHHSYISKCLKINKFYKGKGYYITKNLSSNNEKLSSKK
jgi:GIY-YIG catalytic domain/NUMOD1 domain